MHNKHYLHMQTFVAQIFLCFGLKNLKQRAPICALQNSQHKKTIEKGSQAKQPGAPKWDSSPKGLLTSSQGVVQGNLVGLLEVREERVGVDGEVRTTPRPL
jgi:hypothetical protein